MAVISLILYRAKKLSMMSGTNQGFYSVDLSIRTVLT